MISDYTERVQRLQRGSCTSKLMIDVVNYIRHHISEPITVEKMAKALFMSRPYLSRKFKEETGESLTDFILYEKTEEAKRLLRYSDKPITAISSYLGFSSPSHSSLSVQIFAVAGNHIFIPSKGLFPVPCRRPVRVPGKAPVILPGFILPVRPLGR